MNWRQRLGAFVGGFDAGQQHRRLRGFRATRAHVNALIAASGPDITARARWLVRNNGYAVNAVESWAANTVGDGIKPISKIADAARKEELQRLWLAWTDEADAEGLTDFYGLQRRAAREVFLAGEVFFRFRPRRAGDGLSVPVQLQMLPAEMFWSRRDLQRTAMRSARASSSTGSADASPITSCAATPATAPIRGWRARSCGCPPPR